LITFFVFCFCTLLALDNFRLLLLSFFYHLFLAIGIIYLVVAS